MTLYDKIIAAYPELTDADFGDKGSIELRNDGNGESDYIAKWDFSQPIPIGLKFGK